MQVSEIMHENPVRTLTVRRILVPIDWAELSNRAFKLAVTLARQHHAELLVLNVVPLPTMMYGPPPETYLKNLREKLCRSKTCDPQIHIEHHLAEGDPAAAILQLAREGKCDLIVMGTHGREGLYRFVMGSVAEEVIRKAPCLVLTVNSDVPVSMIED